MKSALKDNINSPMQKQKKKWVSSLFKVVSRAKLDHIQDSLKWCPSPTHYKPHYPYEKKGGNIKFSKVDRHMNFEKRKALQSPN